ncbi:MAG: hypothetical protein O9248_01395, partial [Rhodobacteraceae bacterium]|nr:hypothetical protein [Paracoccaceae bacterium]
MKTAGQGAAWQAGRVRRGFVYRGAAGAVRGAAGGGRPSRGAPCCTGLPPRVSPVREAFIARRGGMRRVVVTGLGMVTP